MPFMYGRCGPLGGFVPALLRGGYDAAWATQEGLHTAQAIVRGLDARFDRRLCRFGPYFFADLADTTQADEQAAIGAGQIQATGIWYAGRRR